MSDIGVQQARMALQSNPTRARHWEDYVQALLSAGQLVEADKAIALAARKGLAQAVLHDLTRRQAQAQQSTAAVGAARRAMPVQQEINRLAELFQAQRFEELVLLAQRTTTEYPDFPFGWSVLGAALAAQGNHMEALAANQRVVAIAPLDANAHNNLGNVLNGMGRHDDARTAFLKAIELAPDSAEIHYNFGKSLHDAGQLHQALDIYKRSIELDQNFVPAYCNLGKLLNDQRKPDEAIATYEQALALDKESFEAHVGMGLALFSAGNLDKAHACYVHATQLQPGRAEGHYNVGVALNAMGRLDEAERAYRTAMLLEPDRLDAHYNLGITLRDQGRIADAEQTYRNLLLRDPAHVAALINIGAVLTTLGRMDDADEAYRSAMVLTPKDAGLYSSRLFSLNYAPDKSAEEIYAAYDAYERQFGAPLRAQWASHANAPLSLPGAPLSPRRLRIGYVSPDLRQHSVRHFLEPLLASHDRSRFEIFAYAELAREDAATARYRTYCDHFILTRGMSDEELAARVRADAVDVLIDVAGHTAGNRLLTFARKPAPVSLSWLGYGYTTGLKAIDYLLTDEASAPVGSEHLFSEVPWRLPSTGYVFRPDPAMGEVSPLPALANGFVTFGTLTRAIRLNHRTVRVWAEILQRVPGSRLVIDSKNFQQAAMQDAMAERFTAHGIARERLLIGYHSPPWDTLRAIDIGLDCFPHNSGTTLFETLFMGVPIVTLAGRPSVGRLGKSILTGLDNPRWIDDWCAHSEEDYIDKAVALASDLPALQQIRSELRPHMQRSALRDEAGFARRMENAFTQMFQLSQEQRT